MLDLATRRIVGWAMSDTMDVALPLAALRMALAARRLAAGLILYSDRGSQNAAKAYRAALNAAGAIPSMGRTGNYWDNPVAESFFATLEHELIVDHDWATHTQARQDIFVVIEEWYNRKRQHSSVGYVSPAQYEQVRFTHSARAA